MASYAIGKKESIWNAVKSDRLILLCLFISITHIFFQWYEVLMAIPLLFLLSGKGV